jgi:hypothetical protein
LSELVLRPSDVPANFNQQMEMAKAYAVSSLLPGHLRGKPENVLVILGAARALDIPVFWAFQSLFVVSGKLGMEASLMRALAIRAGHQFETRKMSREEATVAIKRADKSSWFEVSFDMTDAKIAKLAGDNWTKYPRSMLHARATAMAIRAECPEVLYGIMYTPEELGAKVDDEGHPVVNERDGTVILDSTAEEVPPIMDDATLNRIYETMRSDTLDAAGNSYILSQRLAHTIPPDGMAAIYNLWTTRLTTEAYRNDATPEDMRKLWQLAARTNSLDMLIDTGERDSPTLRSVITSRVEAMTGKQEAVTDEQQSATAT